MALTLFLIAGASTPGAAKTVELGLTPTPVYGLWTNINKALIAYAGIRSSDKDWLNQLTLMKPEKFSGKVPSNVLGMVKQFAARMDELDTNRTGQWTDMLLNRDLPNLLASDQNQVTPSMVYLHSGQVLVNVAEIVLKASPTSTEISPFFQERNFTGKSPNDVYGLVDLGLRRLDEILIRQNDGQLTPNPGAR